MRIFVDAMGGDDAPLEIIKGCLLLKNEKEITPILVGNLNVINDCAEKNGLDISGLEIVHAEECVGMDESPMLVRSRRNNSMKIGLQMLKEGKGEAFVSAGNTGALQVGANLFARRIPGIERSVIGAIVPAAKPLLLLDSGANTTFSPEYLRLYGIMGSIYMKKVYGIERPRVGLLNIGIEEFKGTPDHVAAHKLLSECAEVNFVGNIESNAVTYGVCDVLVSDGFSGNILLKALEGLGKYTFERIDELASEDDRYKDAEKPAYLDALKKEFDTREYGGAPLIGIASPVIKAHGNSNAKALKNAVIQAYRYAKSGVIKEIEEQIERQKQTVSE